jgi:hypothetical protein
MYFITSVESALTLRATTPDSSLVSAIPRNADARDELAAIPDDALDPPNAVNGQKRTVLRRFSAPRTKLMCGTLRMKSAGSPSTPTSTSEAQSSRERSHPVFLRWPGWFALLLAPLIGFAIFAFDWESEFPRCRDFFQKVVDEWRIVFVTGKVLVGSFSRSS